MINKGYVMDRYRWELYAMLKKAGYDAEAQREKTRLRHNYRIEDRKWTLAYCSEDGETVIYKRLFDTPFSPDDWEEFVDYYWEEINSPYDCTGKRFTVGIDRYVLKDGRTWVYHTMGLDV